MKILTEKMKSLVGFSDTDKIVDLIPVLVTFYVPNFSIILQSSHPNPQSNLQLLPHKPPVGRIMIREAIANNEATSILL